MLCRICFLFNKTTFRIPNIDISKSFADIYLWTGEFCRHVPLDRYILPTYIFRQEPQLNYRHPISCVYLITNIQKNFIPNYTIHYYNSCLNKCDGQKCYLKIIYQPMSLETWFKRVIFIGQLASLKVN